MLSKSLKSAVYKDRFFRSFFNQRGLINKMFQIFFSWIYSGLLVDVFVLVVYVFVANLVKIYRIVFPPALHTDIHTDKI